MEKMTVKKQGKVARVVMTNAEKHNAFDDGLIADLTAAFKDLDKADDVAVVVLESEGKSFSAGADLNWMKRMADYTREENVEDARGLAALLDSIDRCSKPVIAKVQGASYGGGVGLVAACDIAVVSEKAKFCLSEVKLGLIPAVISPYVVRSLGVRACQRFFLTAEVFGADVAEKYGLATMVVAPDALDETVDGLIQTMMGNSPAAMVAAKDLIRAVHRPIDGDVLEETANRIADTRASVEGREGVSAFLEKREPFWRQSQA